MKRIERPSADAAGPEPAATGLRRPIVAAPAVTRVAALGIVLGVLAQAVLAGGFLAGRPGLRVLHEYVGYSLLAAAVLVLVAGLVGRRSRPEPLSELGTRATTAATEPDRTKEALKRHAADQVVRHTSADDFGPGSGGGSARGRSR